MIIKGKTYLLILVCLGMAFTVYLFENKVHEITEKIQTTEEKLKHYDEDLKVLEAEWSYLNNPQRLTNLAAKINDNQMNSPAKMQFTNLRDLPNHEVQFTNNVQSQLTP